MLCRQAFIDKALAFPDVEFHLSQEGNLKLVFPQAGNLKDRFAAFLSDSPGAGAASKGDFLHEIHALGEGFRLTLVVGGPELYRNDRRLQFIFANHRRIQDFSLIQALEYGVQGWFPNGVHPVGAIFIEIDPALADFNIHPAKREARFADAGAIHHAVTTTLRNFLRNAPSKPPGPGQPLFSEPYPGAGRSAPPDFSGGRPAVPQSGAAGTPDNTTRRLAMEALLDTRQDFAPLPGRERPANGPDYAEPGAVAETAPPYQAGRADFRFIGRVFGLFLLVEKEDRLFIIDQHAAHERILYNRFRAAPILKQELLVPIYFDSKDRGEDLFLAAKRDEFAKLGVLIEEEGNGRWQISALPEGWQLSDTETVEALRELQNTGENMAERWLATLSCHRAIKDGDYLDETSAAALAAEALALPVPRCPHGRPVWVEISRNELYKGVRRL